MINFYFCYFINSRNSLNFYCLPGIQCTYDKFKYFLKATFLHPKNGHLAIFSLSLIHQYLLTTMWEAL